MTLVIDLVRALREPEYRAEVSEELEGDITDEVRLEAADEIERLRAVNAELVKALDDCRKVASSESHTLPSNCGCRHAPLRGGSHGGCCCRDTQQNLAAEISRIVSRARAKEDT